MKPPRNHPRAAEEPGPSHAGDDISPEQMREIQEAVQAIPPMNDPSFRDPLGDYCDGSSFNIVQFLADDKDDDDDENDSPSVSPQGAGGQQHRLEHNQLQQQHNQQMVGLNNHDPNNMQQHHMQQQQQQQQGNNNRVQVAVESHMQRGGGSQLPGSSRLPDSPPITDVSAGSSGSPSSSNSAGSPYSPDNYGNYNALNGNNAGGLILGVNDLAVGVGAQDVGMLDALMMPQTGIPANGRHPQQMQQGAYLHSPYQTQPNQLSPPEMAMGSANQAQYAQQMDDYGMDMYGDMGCGLEQAAMGRMSGGPSRKRARNDQQLGSMKAQQVQVQQQAQPVFDMSRVKPDPTMLSYPQPTASRFMPPTTPGIIMASSPIGGESYMDENFRVDGCPQVIKFWQFAPDTWQKLYDEHRNPLNFAMHVVADKGFNYSSKDNCFVNQKKNHFQVSVNIEACDDHPPAYVLVDGELQPILKMQLAFCGVKSEMHTTHIEIKQSQNDRRPGVHKPVELDMIPPRQVTKVTVPRLHFSETTLNNQRKNNKPNPDQKYFLLLVRLIAVTTDGKSHLVLAYASDKVIVRATNPGQFEPPEQDIAWQNADGMMYTHAPVSIGGNLNFGGLLNVNGDIMLTGQVQQPSDRRLKENIVNLDKKEAMDRLNKLRIVEYNYKDEVARTLGMSENAKHRYGIIAQELEKIHPQSVNKEGEFLTVDENRIFYDNIAAVQELSKLHEDLEVKIDGRVDHMQAFFSKIFRRKDTKPVDGISVISEDSGLAGQKALSTSRYSLASTFKREIAKQSKQEACRNPGCSRSDQSHCSSKLTQGTIVTLVVVMAVCLLSMSALYVLDWHHRNYGIHAIVAPPKDGDADSLGMMKKTITMPRHQPGAPPLHDMCLHAGCRSFCCDKKVEYSTELRQGGFDINTVVPLAGSKKAFLAAIAGAEKMTPTAFFPKPLFSGTRFVVEGMNMTIDSRYCVERSCNEKKGRYHLFVPVSPYMPTTPVMLRITPPPGMFVQSCGHMLDFQEEECPAEGHPHFTLNMPTSTRVERDLFEISAGSYKRSGYRFRVGTNTESCFGSEERFKSSYEEYNIIFYRTCGDDSDQAQTTIEIESERDFGFVPGTKPAREPRPNATAA